MEQSAAEELSEFALERAAANESVEAHDAFREKWFGRYPQFDRKRKSLFRCCNDIEYHIGCKAASEAREKQDEPNP